MPKYQYNEKGSHIAELQKNLINKGYTLPKYGVDGRLGLETLEAVLAFEKNNNSSKNSFIVNPKTVKKINKQKQSNTKFPIGKGIFIRSYSHLQSPEIFEQKLIECEIDWVAVLRIWQHKDRDDRNYNSGSVFFNDYLPIIKKTNTDLWVWGWPISTKYHSFIETIVNYKNEAEASGIIIDVESDWKNKSMAAQNFVNELLDTDISIGVTSYGAPWYHKSFPFKEFSVLDFGLPQIYDMDNNMPDNYPARSVEEWTKLGYKKVSPASPAFGKTNKQIEDILQRTPTPDKSDIFWDWYNITQKPSRWNVIKTHSP